MILYNVTVKIDHDVHGDWKKWMVDKHIPDVMATGCFVEYRMSRLLGMDDTEGPTYSIQYAARDMETFERYQSEYAATLQREHTNRYKDTFVAFRTLMELISSSI